MTDCVIGDDLRCEKCGRPAKVRRLRRYCISNGPRPQVKGLGDMTADFLASVGITKERAQAVASAVGIEDCGCAERQEKLNELGRKLGIGTPTPSGPVD